MLHDSEPWTGQQSDPLFALTRLPVVLQHIHRTNGSPMVARRAQAIAKLMSKNIIMTLSIEALTRMRESNIVSICLAQTQCATCSMQFLVSSLPSHCTDLDIHFMVCRIVDVYKCDDFTNAVSPLPSLSYCFAYNACFLVSYVAPHFSVLQFSDNK